MKSVFELKVTEDSDGSLDVMLMVDGMPFGDDCVDLLELKKSAIISGAYDLQTCGCGEPGCAGFFEPIFVQHEADVIRWEFDELFHPTVIKDKSIEMTVGRYEFDRAQYIKEIQAKFAWLSKHQGRENLGPYGFDPAILDEGFPDPDVAQIPYPQGATIVFGYTIDYRQPWVWVEENPTVRPQQLLPTGSMWFKYGCWSLMWGSQHFDLGQCIYRKDSETFLLCSDVTIIECNQMLKSLAQEVQLYWGATANVVWEMLDETGNGLVKRAAIQPSTSV